MKKSVVGIFLFALSIAVVAASPCDTCSKEQAIECMKKENPDLFDKVMELVKSDNSQFMFSFAHKTKSNTDNLLLKKPGGDNALEGKISNPKCLKKLENTVIAWDEVNNNYTLHPASDAEKKEFKHSSDKKHKKETVVITTPAAASSSTPSIVNQPAPVVVQQSPVIVERFVPERPIIVEEYRPPVFGAIIVEEGHGYHHHHDFDHYHHHRW